MSPHRQIGLKATLLQKYPKYFHGNSYDKEVLHLKIFVPGDYSFDMKCQEVHGDVAYIVWKAETPKLVVEMGTDTFVVRNGKIAVQTFSVHMVPK